MIQWLIESNALVTLIFAGVVTVSTVVYAILTAQPCRAGATRAVNSSAINRSNKNATLNQIYCNSERLSARVAPALRLRVAASK